LAGTGGILCCAFRCDCDDLPDADMLLGSDFFVSHHVFVANSQHKLYVTYNGGPVFNLTKTTRPPGPRRPELFSSG